MLLLGGILRCARYGPTERLPYPRTMSGCSDGGASLYVELGSIKAW